MNFEKKATKEQIDEAVKEVTKQFSTMKRDHLIGFLLGAKDDDMFTPSDDTWLDWPDSELVDAAVDSYFRMAVEIIKGKTLKSELRGSTPFGVA
jgi:hypothetical protein